MRKLILPAIVAGLLAVTPIYAQEHHRPGPGGGGPDGPRQHGPRQQDGGPRNGGGDGGGDRRQDDGPDLAPYVQQLARQNLHGRALAERLERLLQMQRSGNLPPLPGGGGDGDGGPRPQGPRGQGRPGGDGGGDRPMNRNGFRPQPPQGDHRDAPGDRAGGQPGRPDGARPTPRDNPGPSADGGTADTLRQLQQELRRMHDQLSKLEQRMDGQGQPQQKPQSQPQPKQPPKGGDGPGPKRPVQFDGDGDRPGADQ